MDESNTEAVNLRVPKSVAEMIQASADELGVSPDKVVAAVLSMEAAGHRKGGMVLDEWSKYAEQVLPKPCGPVQLKETRLAFWAGAAAMFGLITSIPPGTEEKVLADLNSLQDELSEFAGQLRFQQSINEQVHKATGGGDEGQGT